MNQPMPLPEQTPAQPIVTHVPKTAPPLPESVTQSQVQPQYITIPLTQPHQPVNPTHIGLRYNIGHLHPIMICMQDLHQDPLT